MLPKDELELWLVRDIKIVFSLSYVEKNIYKKCGKTSPEIFHILNVAVVIFVEHACFQLNMDFMKLKS